MRDVVVSAGAAEPRTLVVTDTTGADLTACTFEVQLAPAEDEPTEAGWVDVAADLSEANTVATIPCQVKAPDAVPGRSYRVCVRLTDGVEVYVLTAPEIVNVT